MATQKADFLIFVGALDGAIARGFRRPNLFDQAQFSIVTEFAIGRVRSYRSLAPDLGDEGGGGP